MAIFNVEGPHKVPIDGNAGGKLISEDLSEFWESTDGVRNRKGCYVLAVKAGKGYTPLYVGRTTKTFEKECFTDHKVNHYHRGLSQYAKGTPVMFFVVLPTAKGKPNHKEIREMEDFLIQVGRAANPNLRNIQNISLPSWGIKGVIRGGKGKPSQDARKFKKALKME